MRVRTESSAGRLRLVRVGDEIPSEYVVDQSIGVVVHAIACDLARIRPCIDVWM